VKVQPVITLLIGCALGTLLLASVAAATPGARSGGDAFPGRSGELVFAVTNRSRYYPELYLMRSDGTGLRRITSRGGYSPAWSPDGKWLAFASNRSRPRHANASEIYVMRANGTALRRVTRNGFVDFGPAWAPDGKRLVLQSSNASGTGIAVINVNGTGFRRLTHDSEAGPAWSPDGTTIAYGGSTGPSGAGIWLMNPDGTNRRQLTFPPQHPEEEGVSNGADYSPEWSPDSGRIAFTRSYRGRNDIYTIRVDGTGLRRLTNRVGQHYEATWSPNGRRIVFITALYQRRVIDVMNADGTQQRRLITGRGGYIDPDWQPLPRREAA
jgi:Tol biopolymer transport system component